MGRTVATYRQRLKHIIQEWNGFKRALRREDRERFERLMRMAQRHASAASYQPRTDPMDSVVLSILLEMEKEIETVQKQ
ncbi:MAG: hypothetical protein ACP5FL_07965, partial [Thermoplasmatota archaeon]